MMQFRRIFEHNEFEARNFKPEARDSFVSVSEQTFLESRVGPGPRDDRSAGCRRFAVPLLDLVLDFAGFDDAFLDQ